MKNQHDCKTKYKELPCDVHISEAVNITSEFHILVFKSTTLLTVVVKIHTSHVVHIVSA